MSDVIDNLAESRFELTREGHTAELTYSVEGDRITLIHTGVPEALEGHGIGGQLVKAAIGKAVQEGLTIIPVCPYARSWLRKHADVAAVATIDWLPQR